MPLLLKFLCQARKVNGHVYMCMWYQFYICFYAFAFCYWNLELFRQGVIILFSNLLYTLIDFQSINQYISENCQICVDNMYQDQYGQTECKPCPAGYYSSKSKERCKPCDVGLYSPGNGIDGCITCNSNNKCPCLDESTCFNVGNSKALCVNTGGGGNYECSNCPSGFIGDGVNCADIDEVCSFDIRYF